jgi:hypothetical protein
MDSDSFSPTLDPFHTDVMKIIRECLLEGTHSTRTIKTELYKLNVYGMHLTLFNSLPFKFDSMLLPR